MRKSEFATSILMALAVFVSGIQAAKIWLDSADGSLLVVADAGATPDAIGLPSSPPRTSPPADAGAARSEASFLPAEAARTLAAIDRGGPHAYPRDGSTFQNREGRLEARPRGYYREYTVETPGSPDRGARRIITGGDPVTDYFYTDDHYVSFRRFEHVVGGRR